MTSRSSSGGRRDDTPIVAKPDRHEYSFDSTHDAVSVPTDDERPMFEHFYETIERNCPVVYEIPGGMLYGTRVDLRMRPSTGMKSFTISLQRDIVGSRRAGVAMRLHYDVKNEEEVKCVALVGDETIETPIPPIKKELFENRFFVLSISTMPLRYKIYVDSIFLAEQQHFVDVQNVLYLRVDGDLLVYCAEVTDNFSSQHLLPVGRTDDDDTLPKKPLRSIPVEQSDAAKDRRSLEVLPKEYQTMLSELEEQSSRIDEEIKRISEKPVAKSKDSKTPTKTKSKRKSSSAEKVDESDDDQQRNGDRKAERKPGDKKRFGRFFKKLSVKKYRKSKKSADDKRTSDSEYASDLSSDFESYLMMTDSDFDSQASPTELLQEVERQEQLLKERRERKDRLECTHTPVLAQMLVPDEHSQSEGEQDGNQPTSQIEIPFSELECLSREGPIGQVIRIRTPLTDLQDTKLRISTQLLGEDGSVITEKSEEVKAPRTFTGVHDVGCTDGHKDRQCSCPCHQDTKQFIDGTPRKFHVVHHHVHHHVKEIRKDDSVEKVNLEGGFQAPPYAGDPPGYTPVPVGSEAKENTHLLRRQSGVRRWRWLCCYSYSD